MQAVEAIIIVFLFLVCICGIGVICEYIEGSINVDEEVDI